MVAEAARGLSGVMTDGTLRLSSDSEYGVPKSLGPVDPVEFLATKAY